MVHSFFKIIAPVILLTTLLSCESDVAEGKLSGGTGDGLNTVEGKHFAITASKLDSFFRKRFERGLFNGTVLYSYEGNVIYKNAFGYSDLRAKDTLNIDSPFQLASVSKPITAYAVMLLKQKGLISYDDSLKKFFPGFPYDGITIKMLLTHRSGLPNYMYFADKHWNDKSVPINNKDVVDLMIEKQPQIYYLPDKRYNYSNTNYCLLARIIEIVSGSSFEDFMKLEIFGPLGMTNTFVYRKTESNGNDYEVTGYVSRRRKAEDSYLNGVVGDKGIYSTVVDLHKFDSALRHGTLVTREELEHAYELAHKELYDHDNYGFGWRINKGENGDKLVYHTGWWKGFRSYFIRNLNEKKTIIVLTNNSRIGMFGISELCDLFDLEQDR